MDKNKLEKLKFIGQVVLIVFLLLVLILCIGIKIYVLIEFGDMPISEVPTWAVWWMTGGK